MLGAPLGGQGTRRAVHLAQSIDPAEMLEHISALLGIAGCESPRRDAEVLLADTLGVTVSEQGQTCEIRPEMAKRVIQRTARRAAREPIEYIVGYVRFRRIELLVDPRALVPNEETAGALVDLAVGLPPNAKVHDVGTGSGALALAIKYERPDLTVSGSDISPAALAVAQLNAERLDLDVALSVARDLPSGQYDLVVANLPYADEAGAVYEAPPEYSLHQPRVGVFGGRDGLDVIRGLIAAAPAGTRLALEHAPVHTDQVRGMLREPETYPDVAGDPRVTVGWTGAANWKRGTHSGVGQSSPPASK
jgi:release factor glutamine methyltransferase